MAAFLEGFFTLAARRFGAPGETRRVAGAMHAAARVMFGHCERGRTLDEVFLAAFAPAVGLPAEEVRARLASFFREEYGRMRRLVRPVPAARPLLEHALGLGLELVLATNPVFFLEAILGRVRWAGLEGIPFALVTGAELMHAAKPRPEYYEQVLALAGRSAAECLMVGDDPRMDMAARTAGIGTWLAVRGGGDRPGAEVADRAGTLDELAAWLGEPGTVR
jgi:FMN phosphatase YigB (HAD superfamily)